MCIQNVGKETMTNNGQEQIHIPPPKTREKGISIRLGICLSQSNTSLPNQAKAYRSSLKNHQGQTTYIC